jgi:dephospho-CoA kinase
VNSTTDRPLRIGLTGGIASGKSTVAEIFAELGALVIDTDVIAREVVGPGQPALDEIRQVFGPQVFAPDGTLDRAAMRAVIFADETGRHKLEAILHPRIQEATMEQAASAGGAYQLIVVPLLVESPLRSFVDRVLVVDCDKETQIRRLLARDAENEQQARRMIAAQASREERLAIADDVIQNDGELREARDQVLALHQSYLQRASHNNP